MHILVAGLINIETTLQVERFPVEYAPVRYPFFGVNTTVSGVGYNIAKALTTLGAGSGIAWSVSFLSLVGQDYAGELVQRTLIEDHIPTEGVLRTLPRTPQSVILYEPGGGRMIFTDLKDIQDQPYPLSPLAKTLGEGAPTLAVLCNINFARPMLALAQAAALPIATDVHALGSLDDPYNQDFMAAANILFMSHEHLPEPPDSWVRRVYARFGNEIIVIGLGAQGALLYQGAKDQLTHVPAVTTRPVVNTIGAGDALFSAFVYDYTQHRDPLQALRRAVVFASYKIGVAGAADGFLSASQLDALMAALSA